MNSVAILIRGVIRLLRHHHSKDARQVLEEINTARNYWRFDLHSEQAQERAGVGSFNSRKQDRGSGTSGVRKCS